MLREVTEADIRGSPAHGNSEAHLYAALERRIPGHVCEFGVWQGTSLRNIAERVDFVHGFDSFEGLPIPWITQAKQDCTHPAGYFKTDVNALTFPANARIWKGWFSETIPQFLVQVPGQIGFLHIDSDLYESCREVLFGLNNRIVPGAVICFDELYDNVGNYDLWRDGEVKALNEWLAANDRRVEMLSRSDYYQAAVIVRQ